LGDETKEFRKGVQGSEIQEKSSDVQEKKFRRSVFRGSNPKLLNF
jgi:hypothetical protein